MGCDNTTDSGTLNSINANESKRVVGHGPLLQAGARLLFRAACRLGKPFGGIRPRRLYSWLAQIGYSTPDLRWHTNKWGAELKLSPYYHIDRAIIAFGTYDSNLHDYIERAVKPGMVCFDIGANMGEVALHMGQRAGAAGKVFAFEPVPWIAARLRENIGRNAMGTIVRTFETALSRENGSMRFRTADATNENQGQGSLANTSNAELSVAFDVQTQTLDDFVRSERVDRIDLMKIDIQGGEWFLLDGAQKTLKEHRPTLLMEVSHPDLMGIGRSGRDLCVRVAKLGYSLIPLDGRGIGMARALDAASLPENFSAENLLCVPLTSPAK